MVLLNYESTSRKKLFSNSKEIISEIFKVSLISYLFLLFIETFEPGFVKDYLNLNIIIYILILSGIITTIIRDENKQQNLEKGKIFNSLIILFFSIGSAVFIFFQIKEIGNLSYYLSILVGIIVALILFIYSKDDENI